MLSVTQRSFLQPAGASVDLANNDPVGAVDVDVGRARHTGIEAPDGAQDVDPLVLVRARKLLQNRRVEDGLLVRPGVTPGVSGTGVPGGRRDDLVVAQQAVVDDSVMRQVAAAGAPQAHAELRSLARRLVRCFDALLP